MHKKFGDKTRGCLMFFTRSQQRTKNASSCICIFTSE